MNLRRLSLSLCALLLVSDLAFAGQKSDWQQGIVRDVTDNYSHTSVVQPHGNPGFVGTGTIREFCTVEVGNMLYVGERDVARGTHHTSFVAEDSYPVDVQFDNGAMVLKDAAGHRQTFQIVRTLPNDAADAPDPTAFSAPPLEIQ